MKNKNIFELIEELCPNGVEFKKLSEVCDIVQGYAFKSNTFHSQKTKDFIGLVKTTNIQDRVISEDKMEWIDLSDYPKLDLDTYVIKKNRIVIGMSGTIKVGMNTSNNNYLLNQRVGMFIPNEKLLNNCFLNHLLHMFIKDFYAMTSDGSVKNLSSNDLKNFEIPIPPMEIQEEIVRILDKFTMLEAELEAELEARIQQYEYYRDTLLDFKVNNKIEYPIVKLGEICPSQRGKRLTKNDLSKNEKYAVYQNCLTPLGYYHEYNVKRNTVFIICAGAAGEIGYSKEDFWAADDCYFYNCPNNLNSKFLFYYLMSQKYIIKNKVRYGTIPRISKNDIDALLIPLPPLNIQEKIVNILDNFEKVCFDLKIGLPAEINARKQQYEFYRDGLLEFTKTGNINQSINQSINASLICLICQVFGCINLKLKDIATNWNRGNGIKRDELVNVGIPCIRYGEIYTTYDLFFDKCMSYTTKDVVKSPKRANNGDILFAITGESVEDISMSTAYIGNETIYVGGDIVVMSHNQNAKYLSYVLSTNSAKMQKQKGKIKSKVVHSKQSELEEIIIPIPSLEEQQKIVDILDKFYKLCNDIQEGIPAEIAANHQRYEYYRDKLLSFNKKVEKE